MHPGRTVTDFVTTALQDAAKKAVEESSVRKLSQDQQKAFVDALRVKPPAPNNNLRAAYKHYEKAKAAGR